MANACMQNVTMNSPMTSTAAIEAVNSAGVSFAFSAFFFISYLALTDGRNAAHCRISCATREACDRATGTGRVISDTFFGPCLNSRAEQTYDPIRNSCAGTDAGWCVVGRRRACAGHLQAALHG